MSVDELPPPLQAVPAGDGDGDALANALTRLADDSQRLRDLARSHDLSMLDYLLGMVVLEADLQRRRRRTRPD